MRIVSTLIDFLVPNATGSPAGPFTFTAEITKSQSSHQYPATDIRGRGTAGPRVALEDFAASGVEKGKVQKAGFPYPTNPKFAMGVLRHILRFDLATQLPTHYIDLPIAIHTISFGHDNPKEETWDVSLSWAANGTPTITWGGSQVSISTPNPYDQTVYPNLTKTYDPNGLISGATQRTYAKGISDSDAAEVTKLVGLVAAAVAPMSNLKVLNATLAQRTSSDGIFIDIAFVLQDSKDNVETPQNIATVDPNDLTSATGVAKVWPVGTPPSAPATPTNQKLIDYTDKKLNDQYNVRIYRWGKKDSIDDIQIPATFTIADANNMASVASIALIDATPSTPSGFVARTSKTQFVVSPTLGVTHSVTTNEYGLRSTTDDVEMPGTWNRVDLTDLKTQGMQTKVYLTSGGVPADPTPPTGQRIIARRIVKENTINSRIEWYFAKDTSIEEWVNEHSTTLTDPSNINSRQTTAAVDTTPPALSSGFVDRGVELISITHDHTGQVRQGGLLSVAEDHSNPASYAFRSGLAPARDAIATVLNSSSTDQIVADAQWASFQSQANAWGLTVHTINRQEKLLVLEYNNPGKRVVGGTRGGRRLLPALLRAGEIDVYLDVKTISTSPLVNHVRHQSVDVRGYPVRAFTVVRLFQGTTIPDHASLEGTVNNASFLGLSAGTCEYVSCDFDTNIGLGTTFSFLMYYHFEADAAGILKYYGYRDQSFTTTATLTAGSGWSSVDPASSVFAANNEIKVELLTQADFSPFLA